MEKLDVVIIGAGSAGLSALRQVQRHTDRYRIVDNGPLGTTCARIGCMPSKALIHAARQFYDARTGFAARGIRGADGLVCELPAVLRHVREQRNRFAQAMAARTRELAGDRLVETPAVFESLHRLRLGDTPVETAVTVIATGGRPVVPRAWRTFGSRLLTSETIFEQDDLPARLAVVGLGPIGLELGQALQRLGRNVTGYDATQNVGGLTDPEVNAAAVSAVESEFPMHLGAEADVTAAENGLQVRTGDTHTVEVDAVIAAMGVRPNLDGLHIDRLGIDLDARGLPAFDCRTMQIGDLPLFVAGDASRCRPILHEALDEGFIAGRNATAGRAESYCRRVPLRIVFSEPQLAVAGLSRDEVRDRCPNAAIGETDFAEQSRAMIEDRAQGRLHVYADPDSGRLLGAEMACPGAEHLAHQLALMIQNGMTVAQALQAPYYHPTLEEGLRSALRDAQTKAAARPAPGELLLCDSTPEAPLR
ncbi:MAG: dihydrolipoyl dehydrogenase [Lentisphaerae bacterium]|nr:dihydrolipoyl dehydrogenase [Lentisphaerota bacterium]